MLTYLLLPLFCFSYLFAPITAVMDHWGSDVSGPKRGLAPQRQKRYSKTMQSIPFKPDWSEAKRLKRFEGMRIAHFELEMREQARESYEVTCYLATASSKKKGSFNLRIVMEQGPLGSRVRAFDASGKQVRGDVPMISDARETSRAAILPWRDHTSSYYSILIQTIEQEPHVVMIQHSRDRILKEGLFYQPIAVKDMLQTYRKSAPQLGLCERPHCYLDRVEHMRALPIPATSPLYRLTLTEPLFVTWAAKGAAVGVHVRG